MKVDKERVYWRTNKEWWTIVNGKYVLTDKATDRAKRSFDLFKTKKD